MDSLSAEDILDREEEEFGEKEELELSDRFVLVLAVLKLRNRGLLIASLPHKDNFPKLYRARMSVSLKN